MPILDHTPVDVRTRLDTPQGMTMAPGALAPPPAPDPSQVATYSAPPAEPQAPGLGEAALSFYMFDNQIISHGASRVARTDLTTDPEFGSAWPRIKGTKYEKHWDRFADVGNNDHFVAVQEDIDREEEMRRIMDATPLWMSLPLTLAANISDPTVLLPGGAFVRGVKGGVSVARTALSVGAAGGAAMTIQEAGLQATQQTRTVGESAAYIGAGVLFGGLIGAGGARLLSRAEWGSAVSRIERELSGDLPSVDDAVPGPVGAAAFPQSLSAAAQVGASLDSLTIAGRAAGLTVKATSWLNPGLRLAEQPSAVARETGFNLFEMTQYLRGADEQIAAPTAVETLRKEWNAGLMKSVEATRDAWKQYRQQIPTGERVFGFLGGRQFLSKSEFHTEIGRAMRRGDVHEIPQVQQAAQAWRRDVFDPLAKAAQETGQLREDIAVETAVSYFSRMYNRRRLVAEEGLFKDTVTEWSVRQAPRWMADFDADAAAKIAKAQEDLSAAQAKGATNVADLTRKLSDIETELRIEREARFGDDEAIRSKAREIADDVFDKLTGRSSESVDHMLGRITVQARGPLKGRTFMIPDEMIERWLESDINLVGRRYQRIMSADVELARKFGRVDMAEQIKAIKDDYRTQRAAATSEKESKALDKAERDAIDDITALRDLIRGTFDMANWEHNFGRVARVANMLNYIRAMGQIVLSSLPEGYRTAMVHGLRPFMTAGFSALTNQAAFKLTVREAKLAGNIGERAMSHRLATLAEIGDFYTARGPVEKFLANMTEVASSWNGIRLWTDWAKMMASHATQHRILDASAGYAKASARDKRYLAYLSIDEGMAERISKQFADHGTTIDGVKVANTERWTDDVARRHYYAAMNKDIDTQVVTKSVADIPIFANTPVGRMIFQFNSFNLASHQRVLLRGMQEGPARFVSGAIALTSIGMAVVYLRSLATNREVPSFAENPGWWISEGLDYGGLVMVPMQIANAMEKLTGINPVKDPIRAAAGDVGREESSRLGNRNVASVFGPSVGLVEDIFSIPGTVRTAAQGEELKKGQKAAAERLIPFNSYFGLRQMLRYVINPPNE